MCTLSLRHEPLKYVSQLHVALLTILGREPDTEKALGRWALMMDQPALVKETVWVENYFSELLLILHHMLGSGVSDKGDEMK